MHQSPEKTMIALRKLNFAVVVWALASGVAFADTVALKADLEPSSEVPPRVSHGHGMLNATFDTSTRSLQWTITYEGLTGPATAAHFHGPRAGRAERQNPGADREGCAREPDQRIGGAYRPAGDGSHGGAVVLQRAYRAESDGRDSRAGFAR